MSEQEVTVKVKVNRADGPEKDEQEIIEALCDQWEGDAIDVEGTDDEEGIATYTVETIT